MKIKSFLASVLFFSISLTVFAEQTMQWHLLGKQKTNGISGITGIDEEHFLVVHDRKKPYEPRLSVVTWKKSEKPFLTHIDWCDSDNFPIDLEAITSIPNHKKEYLVLESKGKVTRIQLDDSNACKVMAQFDLPTATSTSNMEGLALHCFNQDCVLAWAERGDEKLPAKLSWARFDIEENRLESPEINPFEFNAPYPQANHRSISELAIDDSGNVWVSAVSDPSDVGTFHSAIYKLGSFTHPENTLLWNTTIEPIVPFARYENDNVKIEGLFFTPTGLMMASEDETLGGKIAMNPFK